VPEDTDFVERIVEGFESLRDRPAYRVLADQFEAGELTFIVDRQGIRIHLDQVDPEIDEIDDTVEGLD
jgi:multidrug resistance efflux pump